MKKLCDGMITEKYPAKINAYLANLMDSSEAIQKQFSPSHLELITTGSTSPWDNNESSNIIGLESISHSKAVIMPTINCFAYCRHCIRKERVRKERAQMSSKDIAKVVEVIKENNSVRDVLITGGDPFIVPEILTELLHYLSKLSQIKNIRIGTRITTVNPNSLSLELLRTISQYSKFGQFIELSVQYNHPDELTDQSSSALERTHSSGLRVYNQTVLLKGINDNANILYTLFSELIGKGVDQLYIYHCAPISGVHHFRTTVEKGMEIKRDLTKLGLTGRAIPKYVLVTDVGKLEYLIDCETVKKEDNYLYLRTTYTKSELKSIPKNSYIDNRDFLVIKYLDGE